MAGEPGNGFVRDQRPFMRVAISISRLKSVKSVSLLVGWVPAVRLVCAGRTV
jgi:hypothetical protein